MIINTDRLWCLSLRFFCSIQLLCLSPLWLQLFMVTSTLRSFACWACALHFVVVPFGLSTHPVAFYLSVCLRSSTETERLSCLLEGLFLCIDWWFPLGSLHTWTLLSCLSGLIFFCVVCWLRRGQTLVHCSGFCSPCYAFVFLLTPSFCFCRLC